MLVHCDALLMHACYHELFVSMCDMLDREVPQVQLGILKMLRQSHKNGIFHSEVLFRMLTFL